MFEGIKEKAPVTVRVRGAALVTDAHQYIKTQKGAPARAPQQHHRVSAFPPVENYAVFQQQGLGLLPSLGQPDYRAGCLDSAVLVTGGHGGPRTSLNAERV